MLLKLKWRLNFCVNESCSAQNRPFLLLLEKSLLCLRFLLDLVKPAAEHALSILEVFLEPHDPARVDRLLRLNEPVALLDPESRLEVAHVNHLLQLCILLAINNLLKLGGLEKIEFQGIITDDVVMLCGG